MAFFQVASANAADTEVSPKAPVVTPTPAAPTEANPPGGRNRGNIQRGTVGGGGSFNLDEKQRQLLQEARQVHGDELRKLNDKLAEAQKEFVKAVVAEKYDENAVREKAAAVGKIQAEIMALNGKAFATVSPTLKPEQRESLEGNMRLGAAIISPTVLGGPGGNFLGGPGGPGRGGMSPSGTFPAPDGAQSNDRGFRRTDPPAGDAGTGRGGSQRRRGGPDSPVP